jgi:2-methylcitrate dehydratase PrpD
MASVALGRTASDLLSFPPPGHWLLLEGYLKPFPAVRHVHYGATAAIQWHREVGVPAGRISAITLRVYQEALTYCGNRAPETPIQAQFSLTYGIACALLTGRLDPEAYSATSLADPARRHLEALITLEPDPAMTQPGQRGCTLQVVADGVAWTRTISTIPGDRTMPLSRTEVLEKFMSYAAPVLGAPHATTLSTLLLNGALDCPLSLAA